MALLADDVAPRYDMLQEEQIFARYLRASLLRHSILRLLIALYLPIVIIVAHSVVTVPADFLPLAQWRLLASGRV